MGTCPLCGGESADGGICATCDFGEDIVSDDSIGNGTDHSEEEKED